MEPMEVAMTSVRPMAPISRNKPTAIWCTRNMMHQKVKNLHDEPRQHQVRQSGTMPGSHYQGDICLQTVQQCRQRPAVGDARVYIMLPQQAVGTGFLQQQLYEVVAKNIQGGSVKRVSIHLAASGARPLTQ